MAALTQLAKRALDQRPDPLFDFKWLSDVIPLGLPPDYLESIDIPFMNITVGDAVYAGASFTYYPGTHNVSAFSATFYEDSLCTTLKWILAWKAKIKNFETGVYELPTVYKQDWTVKLLNTKNIPVMNIKLIGVWPSDTSNYSLNYTSNGRLTISQSFSIDNQIITPA